MRDYITSVLLVIMLLFSTLVTAADVKLNDQNSIEVFRLELTKCIIDGVPHNSDKTLKSDLGVSIDQNIKLIEYKVGDEKTRPAIYLDFQILNSGSNLFAISGGIQITVLKSGISPQFETRSFSLNSLHLAPLVGVLTGEDLLGDNSLETLTEFDLSRVILVVVSLRLSGREKNSDVTYIFEKEPHERGTMKDRFSYKFYYGSFRNREYDSLGLFLDDLVVVYRDETRLFSLKDFYVEEMGILEDTPHKGMSTLFVNSCGGRAIGKLFLLTYNADEVINSQCLFLDSYSSWEFRDVDKDGIAELVIPHLGTAYSTCNADNPFYERLVVWRENRWVTDSFGEFPEYYAEKYMNLEREIAKYSAVDDRLVVYYVYYMLMSGLSAEEIASILEKLVTENNLVVRDAYYESREWTIDSNFVQEVLEEAKKFSIEDWF